MGKAGNDGTTDPTPRLAEDLRYGAVRFLDEVLAGLDLDRPSFVANSMGSLWTIWLALDRPERVAGLVHVGCPAIALEASAPLPMRLLSVRPLGWLLSRLQPPSPGQVERLSRIVKELISPRPGARRPVAGDRAGKNDPFGPPEVGERMIARMPAAELHVVGGGHCPWLTQADRIGPIARSFLREHA